MPAACRMWCIRSQLDQAPEKLAVLFPHLAWISKAAIYCSLTPTITPKRWKMSSYTIHEVETRDDIEALVDVCWAGWWKPYLPNVRIALPIFGLTSADRVRAFEASRERMWNDFSKRPKNKVWLCVKHATDGIVGGVVCDYAEGSPFPNGCPKLSLYWWPEGEEVRRFCEEMMSQVYTPRSLWMQRPHGVHPKHRGKGVAKMLLKHNVKELDVRGIEGFVEATEAGRPAYESVGYQVVMKVASYIPAGKSDDWVRWYHEFGISPFYAMWRPKYGKIEQGQRNKPWQQGLVLPTE